MADADFMLYPSGKTVRLHPDDIEEFTPRTAWTTLLKTKHGEYVVYGSYDEVKQKIQAAEREQSLEQWAEEDIKQVITESPDGDDFSAAMRRFGFDDQEIEDHKERCRRLTKDGDDSTR